MIIDHVRYPGRRRDYSALVMRPKVALTSPGILLLHDRWGLTPELEGFGERLTHEGYVVMMPDLYNGRLPKDDGQARHLMHLLGHQEGAEEVKLALHWLRNQAYTQAHRTAVIGFEHHGTLGLLAAMTPKFPPTAVVLFYSPVKEIIGQVKSVQAAVQGHFGEKDKVIPVADVEAFRQALEAAGISHEIHLYKNAEHDFMRPGSAGYNEAIAEDAWHRTLQFLSTSLKKGDG